MAPYKFTRHIYKGLPIEMYGDGTSARDYTYVGDIVEGIVAALNKDFSFEIINLGDSRPVMLKRFIALIEEAVGKKALIHQKEMQQGDVEITYASIDKARKLFGYKPKIKIEEGLSRFVTWYKHERLK